MSTDVSGTHPVIRTDPSHSEIIISEVRVSASPEVVQAVAASHATHVTLTTDGTVIGYETRLAPVGNGQVAAAV